jgi:formylglycine-generating enzyme required for sulfatase activity
MQKLCSLLLSLMLGAPCAIANNVQISNIGIINNGPGAIQVKFDLSWDNSWRTNVGPANRDGVWVFFKYKDASGAWQHINLTGNNNVLPSGFDVYQTNIFNKPGAMIFRDTVGAGTATATNIRLGVINALPYDIDIRGFAIEMVYIPAPGTRPFFGDGNGTTESANALHYNDNTATTGSVQPMKSDGLGIDDVEIATDGIYVYSNDTIQTTNPLGSLDPFPTMKALWCMKYEITQAAYRDFLNTLDSQQQAERTFTSPGNPTGTGALAFSGTARNYIEIATPATSSSPAVYGCDANGNNVYNEAGDGEWIACGFLLYQDVAAYFDWSGLAPMSEIQFERICRGHSSAGTQPAVLGEFAWGTNTIAASSYTLSNAGTTSELVSNASATAGNAAYSATSVGPLRAGIFATGSSSRLTSGASFFGVMEMTGNLEEFVVTIGCAAGRSVRFIPNGNGVISAAGNAQLSVGGAGFWPGMEGNFSTSIANTCSGTCEVTGSAGAVLKGGSFITSAANLPMCSRSYFVPTARSSSRGGRGVLYIR